MVDMVNSPLHYSHGKIECIDAMISAFGIDEVMAFCKLNAFKYLYRADFKGGAEDVAKAQWYINKWLELNKQRDTTETEEVAKNAQPTSERDWRDYFENLCKFTEKKEEKHCENCAAWEIDEDCYPCNSCCNGVYHGEHLPFLWTPMQGDEENKA